MGSLDDRSQSQRRWIAHLVTQALRAQGATDIEYDDQTRLLRYRPADGEPSTADLADLFEACVGEGADERAVHIEGYVGTLIGFPFGPSTWETAAAKLRPVVRPAGYARSTEGSGQALSREFLPLLYEMVVVDMPEKMIYVGVKDVRRWGVAESLVFDRARSNLEKIAEPPPAERRTGGPAMVRMVETGSDYWASNLLLDGWLAGMAVYLGGRPVALLPDTDGLTLVADTAIDVLLTMNEKHYREATRPLSPQAYTVDDAGRVVPYSVPVGDSRWGAVHRSEVLFAVREYEQQAENHDGLDGFLAQLMVKERPGGEVFSLTVWGEGVDGLLPRADYVVFMSEPAEHFAVPWEVAVRETGLVPEPGWAPARFRARRWPARRVLERLRAAAIPL